MSTQPLAMPCQCSAVQEPWWQGTWDHQLPRAFQISLWIKPPQRITEHLCVSIKCRNDPCPVVYLTSRAQQLPRGRQH